MQLRPSWSRNNCDLAHPHPCSWFTDTQCTMSQSRGTSHYHNTCFWQRSYFDLFHMLRPRYHPAPSIAANRQLHKDTLVCLHGGTLLIYVVL